MNKIFPSKKSASGNVNVMRGNTGKQVLRGAATIFDLSGKGVFRGDTKLGTLRSDTKVLREDLGVVGSDFKRTLGEELEHVRKVSDAQRR